MNYKEISIENMTFPNRLLSNFETIDAAKPLKIKNFRDVFMRDALPSKPKVNECTVVNFDSSDGQGTHYVCYFKREKQNLLRFIWVTTSPTSSKLLKTTYLLPIRTNTTLKYNLLRSYLLIYFK